MTPTVDLMRAGGVLLLPSLALVVEGVVRFVSSNPDTSYSDMTTMQELKLVSAIFLVGFGCSGIFTGLSVTMGFPTRWFTVLSLTLQLFLGSASFATFVFADYLVAFDKNKFPPSFPEEFTRNETLHLLWFGGILMSFCISACTQGLQIYCTVVILQHLNETPPAKGAWRYVVMTIFSLFILTGAVGEFAFGSIARAELGAKRLDGDDFIVFPNVVYYTNIPLVTGLIMSLYYLLLCAAMVVEEAVLPLVNSVGVLLLLWLLSAFIMTNIGLGGSKFGGAAATVTVLSTVTAVTPAIVFNEMFRLSSEEKKTDAAIAEILDEPMHAIQIQT